MNQRKCPVCDAVLSEEASVCSACGFGGLNQIFLSQEDRDAWYQEEILPLRAMRRIRVSVGEAHALFLRNSELYGMGSNDAGQLGDRTAGEEKKAAFIARDIRSVAAGRSYSICLSNSGKIIVLGNGEFGDSSFDFPDAEQVYASKTEDVFWIRDACGKLFAFGNNSNEKVEPHACRTLGKFPGNYQVYVRYWRDERVIFSGSSSFRDYTNENNKGVSEKELKHKLAETPLYTQAQKEYNGNNLKVDLGQPVAKKVTQGQVGAPDRIEVITYQPELFLLNQRIFRPVPFAGTCPIVPLVLRESGADSFDATARNKSNAAKWEMAKIQNETTRKYHALFLKNDGTLYLLPWDSDMSAFHAKKTLVGTICSVLFGNKSEGVLLRDVADISVSRSRIALSLRSGKVYMGEISAVFTRNVLANLREVVFP